MGQIADFIGAPPVQNRSMPQNLNPRPIQIPVEILNIGAPVAPVQQPVVEPQPQEEPNSVPILIQRNQDAHQVVRQVQQNNFYGRNNIAIIPHFLKSGLFVASDKISAER